MLPAIERRMRLRKITNKDNTYMDVEDLKVYQRLCKLHIDGNFKYVWIELTTEK